MSFLVAPARRFSQLSSINFNHFDLLMPQQYTSHSRIRARFIPHEFTVNGSLDNEAWKHAQWISFDSSADGKTRYPDLLTQAAMLWTKQSLYLAFRSRYLSLNTYQSENPVMERWELWKRDVVELFVNPFPTDVNRYYEFEVAPNNQWIDLKIDKTKSPPLHDASWNSDFMHATRIDPARHIWTCEICIPIRSMDAPPPHPGTEWRLNLFRSDGPESARRSLAWSIVPGSDTFHVPTRFGALQFTK